jgi:hypothetical protein
VPDVFNAFNALRLDHRIEVFVVSSTRALISAVQRCLAQASPLATFSFNSTPRLFVQRFRTSLSWSVLFIVATPSNDAHRPLYVGTASIVPGRLLSCSIPLNVSIFAAMIQRLQGAWAKAHSQPLTRSYRASALYTSGVIL